MKTVSLNSLSVNIQSMVDEFGEDVRRNAEDVLKRNAEAIKSQIPQTTAFKDTSYHSQHLRNSFEVVESSDDNGNMKYIIQAGTKGRKYAIVHLVENGHVSKIPVRSVGKTYNTKAHGMVPPHPFLGPLVESYSPIVEKEIQQTIENTIQEILKGN